MKTARNLILGSFCLLAVFASPVSAATYTIGADHSAVTFKIRHLFSKTPGNFNQFEGTIEYEPGQPESWKTQAVIQAASIDTNVEKRDNHLRSKEFFDVEKFPTITFKSAKVTDVTDKGAKLHGDLTIHGVTKPVVLDLAIHGVGDDPWGNTRAGFTATTTIDRKEFGITWNQPVVGGLMLGDEVEITLEVEGLLGAVNINLV